MDSVDANEAASSGFRANVNTSAHDRHTTARTVETLREGSGASVGSVKTDADWDGVDDELGASEDVTVPLADVLAEGDVVSEAAGEMEA